jgi:hypothetical protein
MLLSQLARLVAAPILRLVRVIGTTRIAARRSAVAQTVNPSITHLEFDLNGGS